MLLFMGHVERSEKETRTLLPEESKEKPTDKPDRQYFSHNHCPNTLLSP